VPNNDLDAVGGDPTRVGEIRAPKLTRPVLFDAAMPLIYAWTFADAPEAQAHAQRTLPPLRAVAQTVFILGASHLAGDLTNRLAQASLRG
jgi:hypothetical protein